MRNYQTKRSEFVPITRQPYTATLDSHQQGGPFSLIPLQNEFFSFGGTSVISIGSYGSIAAFYDLTGSTIRATKNKMIYCTIPFQDGFPLPASIKQVSVSSPLPMTEYLPDKYPSPKNTKAVNVRLCRTEPFQRGWEFVYGKEGAIQTGDIVVVRELSQSVQIIQTCFGFIATSAVSSYPLLYD